MLVQFVQFMHLLGILFIVAVPFQDEVNWLVVHVSACLSIFTHWLANDNTCFMSLVEAKLRGIPKDHSFIHSMVAPIYDMNKEQTCYLTYFLLFCLMSISLYKIFTSDRWKECVSLYSKTRQFKSFLLLLAPSNERRLNEPA